MNAITPVYSDRLALAGFQSEAKEGLQTTIRKVADYHAQNPSHRKEIALKSGVMLLQSPTGSGKTLILGRTLEGLRGDLPRKCAWFWFAPYSGLVSQTRDSLSKQCGALRLRDIYTDREPTGTKDGDIFVQTWAAVAAQNKDARKVRKTTESELSLDDMIAALRADGFYIGVVIDEAHLNFGASASVAASFYLDHLQPDFTILATATPNDEKLDQFEEKAGIQVASRIVIERGQVVDAGLNKVGLMLGLLRFKPEDEALIDLEQATLQAAWTQHLSIKFELARRSIPLMPLMLVQVEDQQQGDEDPVKRIREKLEQAGISGDKIKSHTSGEPDPDFHTFAYDPNVEVLIFKVAVATGFDAPRAWTLVSVRPNRGTEFGLQIVGRIMRVHPLVRPFHRNAPLLDRGYVFLTDPTLQAGLSSAVDELKAVRHGINLITDQLDVVQFGSARTPLEASICLAPQGATTKPVNDEDRQERLALLIDLGLVKPDAATLPRDQQDRIIVDAEIVSDTPLFGDLPIQLLGRSDDQSPKKAQKIYPLRTELNLPNALICEELPPIHEIEGDVITEIAEAFCQAVDLRSEVNRRARNATLSLRDLFLESVQEERAVKVRLSNARIAERAQIEFRFNDSIDPRQLKISLVNELRRICDIDGIEYNDDGDLRRAIDLAVMSHPGQLRQAVRQALRKHFKLSTREPIPTIYQAEENLSEALKSAYGVFPVNLNKEERAFAEYLDADSTGTVKWWLRNPENATWATRIMLPTGKRFFPDFVVGITNRSTPGAIALVEIKDDGESGRLHSESNLLKIRVQHQEYRNVFWTYRQGDGPWVRARYEESLNRIVGDHAFRIVEMVLIS